MPGSNSWPQICTCFSEACVHHNVWQNGDHCTREPAPNVTSSAPPQTHQLQAAPERLTLWVWGLRTFFSSKFW